MRLLFSCLTGAKLRLFKTLFCDGSSLGGSLAPACRESPVGIAMLDLNHLSRFHLILKPPTFLCRRKADTAWSVA